MSAQSTAWSEAAAAARVSGRPSASDTSRDATPEHRDGGRRRHQVGQCAGHRRRRSPGVVMRAEDSAPSTWPRRAGGVSATSHSCCASEAAYPADATATSTVATAIPGAAAKARKGAARRSFQRGVGPAATVGGEEAADVQVAAHHAQRAGGEQQTGALLGVGHEERLAADDQPVGNAEREGQGARVPLRQEPADSPARSPRARHGRRAAAGARRSRTGARARRRPTPARRGRRPAAP